MTLTWHLLQFALIMMVLVLVHEAGHMVVAKWCGMRVERFSIFFGRPIASFTRGETQYALGWLPLGGYVKISGMTRDEEVPDEHLHRTYSRAATWRKVATIAAGPGVNILLAIVAFTCVFWLGVPGATVVRSIASVEKGGPAFNAGVRPGDRITAVDGVPVTTTEATRTALLNRVGRTVPLTYRHGATTVTKPVTVRQPRGGCDPIGPIGVSFDLQETGIRHYGVLAGIRAGWSQSWFVVSESTKQLGCVFQSSHARDQLQSVVGVGAVYNEIAGQGIRTILQFAAVLSLALAIFNLIPLPPLDGGHIAFALIERVRGRPLPPRGVEWGFRIGLALVVMLMLFTTFNDMLHIASL